MDATTLDYQLLEGRDVEYYRPLPLAGRKCGRVLHVYPRKMEVRILPALELTAERVSMEKVLRVSWYGKMRPLAEWLTAQKVHSK